MNTDEIKAGNVDVCVCVQLSDNQNLKFHFKKKSEQVNFQMGGKALLQIIRNGDEVSAELGDADSTLLVFSSSLDIKEETVTCFKSSELLLSSFFSSNSVDKDIEALKR